MELTADIIKRRSGHYDVGLVALLDVSKMKLRRLGQLESCLNLLELNLAHNELRSLEGMPSLPLLRCLHLNDNQLTSIDNLPHFPQLEELHVADNQIRSIDFMELAAELPSLRVLNFRGNPMDTSATIQATKAFPSLFTLNGEALTLTRLLEEISNDDYTKSTGDEVNAPVDEDPTICTVEAVEEDDTGVNKFIQESTRHLQDLLLQCRHTLKEAKPETIFPASRS